MQAPSAYQPWALCYSVTQYYCPAWARSSYTNLIDVQLHSALRLISGCLQPTQLSWLPVLSNVAPSPSCKAAADSMLQIIKAHPIWPVYAYVFGHPPPRLASQRPICSHVCQHNYAVERELVIGFCGQPHYYYRPYYPTARFQSPLLYMVPDESFGTRLVLNQ